MELTALIKSISNSAHVEAEKIKSDAKRECEEYIFYAKAEAEKEKDKILKDAKASAEIITSRAISEGARLKSDRLLKLKQEETRRVIELSKEEFVKSEKYFSCLENMLCLCADKTKKGEILLNERDLSRLPHTFRKKINEYKLKINEAKIFGGFVLKYEKYEENCSVEAIFDELFDRISDLIIKRLEEVV